MPVDVLPACAYCAWGGQKRALVSLTLELQTVVSCHVGARKLNLGPLQGQLVFLNTELCV